MHVDSTSPPALAHNADHSIAMSAFCAAAIIAALFVPSVVGAAAAWLIWRVTRPRTSVMWMHASLAATAAATLSGAIVFGWPWRLLMHALGYPVDLPTVAALTGSVPVEMMLGPLVFALATLGRRHWR